MFPRRLSITNDYRVQRLIQNKRLASELEERIPKINKSTKMFEQFLILGAPPSFETKTPEPIILSSYPRVSISSRPDNEANMLISFCYPNGFTQIKRDASGLRTILSEFVFYLKEGSDTIYGICLHFRGNDELFFASEKNLNYPFCYCLLTTTPFFSSHFTFLSYFSLLMVKRIKPLPHFDESGIEVLLPAINEKIFASLELDKQYTEIAVYPGLKANQTMRDELSFYYSLPTKSRNKKIFPKITLSSKINLFLPLHLTRNQCIAYSSFHTLFNLLKISDIVTIYTAFLLEMRIVFISKRDLHLLTLSLIAVLSLLKPFRSMAMTVLPILPSKNNFSQILDSPVPYIIGTTSSTKDADLIVNIDTFEVTANTQIPPLPNRNNLIKKITAILTKNQQFCAIPQKRFAQAPNDGHHQPLNKEYLSFIEKYNPYNFPVIYISLMKLPYIFPPAVIDSIIDAFRSNIVPSLSDIIHGCFVTDATDPFNPVTVCNTGLFLCQVPNRDHEFYEKFIQTNIWEVFCDKLSKPIIEFKRSQSLDFREIHHESESEKHNSDNDNSTSHNNNSNTGNENNNTENNNANITEI